MIDYIEKRCKEVGMTNYAVDVRLMILEPEEIITKELHYGEFWVIDNPKTDFGILVFSGDGYFGEFGKQTNEATLQHSGTVKITNITYNRQTLQFWQVVDLAKQ